MAAPKFVGRSIQADKPTAMDILAAYRLFLGREPENAEALEARLCVETIAELRQQFIQAPEFRDGIRPLSLKSCWVLHALPSGRRIWVNLNDQFISHDILMHDEWEASETSYMRARLKPGDTVLDIGASLGWFSLVAADAIGAGKVHAFEPSVEVLSRLKQTIDENQLGETVVVHECALWDVAGEERLLGRIEQDHNLGHTWLLSEGEAPAGVITSGVRTARLDDVADIGPVNFIKIDIEGAEAKALRGGEELLRRDKPIVLSELFPKQMELVSGTSAAGFISWMTTLGYGCWMVENGSATVKLDDFPSAQAELLTVAFEPKRMRRKRQQPGTTTAVVSSQRDASEQQIPSATEL